MRSERIASQSEVIRVIVSGYSPCCGVRAPVPSRRRDCHFDDIPILSPFK